MKYTLSGDIRIKDGKTTSNVTQNYVVQTRAEARSLYRKIAGDPQGACNLVADALLRNIKAKGKFQPITLTFKQQHRP